MSISFERSVRPAFVLATILLVLLPGCRGDVDTIGLTIKGHRLTVEVARTAEERQLGLMNRSEISERGGMLFVFPQEEPRSFWMKDTSIPLSVAFISSAGVILEIYPLEPFSLDQVRSKLPARYALEVRRGLFAELGIGPGDRVIFDEDL